MKSVLGFGPEVATFHLPVEFVKRERWDELTTRLALSFFPDLKTSSPEPDGGISATYSPNTRFIFRAATPALT